MSDQTVRWAEEAIELGILSIGEWDSSVCQCDASVGMTPCHYCAEYYAIRAAKAIVDEIARLRAENTQLRSQYVEIQFEIERLQRENADLLDISLPRQKIEADNRRLQEEVNRLTSEIARLRKKCGPSEMIESDYTD